MITKEEAAILDIEQRKLYKKQYPLPKDCRYCAWVTLICWTMLCNVLIILLSTQFDLWDEYTTHESTRYEIELAKIACPDDYGRALDIRHYTEWHSQLHMVNTSYADQQSDRESSPIGGDTSGSNKWLISFFLALALSFLVYMPMFICINR
eukprot:UN05247